MSAQLRSLKLSVDIIIGTIPLAESFFSPFYGTADTPFPQFSTALTSQPASASGTCKRRESPHFLTIIVTHILC